MILVFARVKSWVQLHCSGFVRLLTKKTVLDHSTGNMSFFDHDSLQLSPSQTQPQHTSLLFSPSLQSLSPHRGGVFSKGVSSLAALCPLFNPLASTQLTRPACLPSLPSPRIQASARNSSAFRALRRRKKTPPKPPDHKPGGGG